ncbi:MAG TPA: hypothetical protein VEH06_00065 [Candidatus Bathyarchaeia archaeon]|nr:hypothetical protein [Candidatus Bathyarchaeia archaeon]
MGKQLADVIEQQQQHADIFDMKFVKLLDIVKTGLVDKDAPANVANVNGHFLLGHVLFIV